MYYAIFRNVMLIIIVTKTLHKFIIIIILKIKHGQNLYLF